MYNTFDHKFVVNVDLRGVRHSSVVSVSFLSSDCGCESCHCNVQCTHSDFSVIRVKLFQSGSVQSHGMNENKNRARRTQTGCPPCPGCTVVPCLLQQGVLKLRDDLGLPLLRTGGDS